MRKISAFWQHPGVQMPLSRENPDGSASFCSEARVNHCKIRVFDASIALHNRAVHVKMASLRALPHLFTEPNRYN
ncbi:hypothetical protein [Candidatus Burkholderia verschuerenii]|uniref:hypothetical protein n=1 Tax=Candidatus Burkholderia verschuerenii TaxID=242163 RepID=UPI0012EE1509|nr:hypothetical protein [Candidatus Burkholderia verschuerenii]